MIRARRRSSWCWRALAAAETPLISSDCRLQRCRIDIAHQLADELQIAGAGLRAW